MKTFMSEDNEMVYPSNPPSLPENYKELSPVHLSILRIVNAHPEGITWLDVVKMLNKHTLH